MNTVTIANLEIRDFQPGGFHTAADVSVYPHPSVRRTMDGKTTWLHRDQLGSVRAITGDAGGHAKQAAYKPFGTVTDWTLNASIAPETKGFIGERYDSDAGLQYLNARYYDPELGIFIQPDWFEVTAAGVGTNRYGYSGNDPVNALDPGGNAFWDWFNSSAKSDRRNQANADSYRQTAATLRSEIGQKGGLFGGYFRDRGLRRSAARYEARAERAQNRVGSSMARRILGDTVAASVFSLAVTPAGRVGGAVAGVAIPVRTARSLSAAAVTKPLPYVSETTRNMNATVSIQNGHATVGFRTRRATSLSSENVAALRAELQANGVNSVVVNTGRIIEPTGRLSNILNTRAQQGRNWRGLTVSPTGNPSNPYILFGVLK